MPRHGVGKAGLLQGNPGIARFAVLVAAVVCLWLVPADQTAAEPIADFGPILTLTKSPDPSTGEGAGTVSSKPKGIACGTACEEAVAWFYRGGLVELTAKPANGDSFVKWEGACSGSSPICTVGVSEAEEVEAVFSGPSKEIFNPQALTVGKGESTGKGTIKAYGSLACEASCTKTTVLYQGPIAEKGKPGRTVVLEQKPAFGSGFNGWSGCDEVTETGYCIVTMESSRNVDAEYTALSNVDLTVKKSAYANGAGSVISKPHGIGCGAYCTQAAAAMPEGSSIELKAKPSKENVFVEWENATEGSDCDESKSLVCVVTMDKAATVTAVFAGSVKAIKPAETLALTKAGSGFGTVKATGGLKCELLCTSTDVIYQGPITEPKPKVGKTVVLKAASAPGSKQVVWTGCKSEPTPTECSVTMESAKTVTATFDELK